MVLTLAEGEDYSPVSGDVFPILWNLYGVSGKTLVLLPFVHGDSLPNVSTTPTVC